MKSLENPKCTSCLWFVDSSWVPPVTKKLGDMGLGMPTSTEVQADFVNTMVIYSYEIIVEGRCRQDTGGTVQMAKLDS